METPKSGSSEEFNKHFPFLEISPFLVIRFGIRDSSAHRVLTHKIRWRLVQSVIGENQKKRRENPISKLKVEKSSRCRFKYIHFRIHIDDLVIVFDAFPRASCLSARIVNYSLIMSDYRQEEGGKKEKKRRNVRMSYDKDTHFDGRRRRIFAVDWMITKIGKLKWCQHEKLRISQERGNFHSFQFRFFLSLTSSCAVCAMPSLMTHDVRVEIYVFGGVSTSHCQLELNCCYCCCSRWRTGRNKKCENYTRERKSKNQKKKLPRSFPSCIIN